MVKVWIPSPGLGALTSFVLRDGAKIVPEGLVEEGGGTLAFSPYKAVLHDLARLDTGKRLPVMRLLRPVEPILSSG